MRVEIKKIQEKLGITTVYVTHDQEEALALSNRIALLNDGKIVQLATPAQIYNSPNSKFVADFIGHSNFIIGKISEILQDKAIIQIFGNLEIITDLSSFMKENKQVTLIIRDENIILSDNKIIGENVFEGEVESSLYLGPFQRIYVRVGEVTLTVYCKAEQFRKTPIRGESIFVQLERNKLMILPGELDIDSS